MNSSSMANKTLNDFEILDNLSNLLEFYDILNMYASLFFLVLGFFGNLSALVVLVYARQKLPSIVGVNTLILLTLNNTAFLLIQSYMYTYTRMIFHLGVGKRFQFFDSIQLVCKMCMYLRYSTRLLNAFTTLCFSLERFVAVYFPLRIRSFNEQFSRCIKISMILSLLIPSYSLYFVELVSSDASREVHTRFNVTKAFSFNSVVPVISEHTCAATKFKLSLFLHCLVFIIVFVSYIIVSVCIIAIVAKLKRKQLFRFNYRSPLRNNKPISMGEINTGNTRLETQEEVDNLNSSNEPSNRRCRNQVRVVRIRTYQTKMLSSISLSFILFNTPYIVSILYFLVYTTRVNNMYELLIDNLIHKIHLQTLVVKAEVFQLVNFSFTGILFFYSGRIFRIHTVNFIKKYFLFKD